MLTVYGPLMPLRLLEEIRFWKDQEKEHTVVIRELIPNLEPDYVKAMKNWEPAFAHTEFQAIQWIEAAIRSPGAIPPYIQCHALSLLRTSIEQTNAFIHQLQQMKLESAAIRSLSTAPIVIDHIIRESEYFLGILQAYLAGCHVHVPLHDQANPYTASTVPNPFPSLQPNAFIRSADHHAGPASGSEAWLTATGEGAWSAAPDSPAHSPDHRPGPVPIGGHRLPPLPYPYDALEPYIDAQTMKLHHDKHHQAYVDGLNNAELQLQKARQTGDFNLIKHWERELAFHGAGHYLHTIFWNIMAPKAGGKPEGPIAAQIDRDFGGFDRFKAQFSAAADKVEGGGWAILVWSPRSHRLEILQAEKHQNLSQWDAIPLLVLDVWEHAYYLKYKNERARYIEAWWNVVNWPHVNERFIAARELKWTPF